MTSILDVVRGVVSEQVFVENESRWKISLRVHRIFTFSEMFLDIYFRPDAMRKIFEQLTNEEFKVFKIEIRNYIDVIKRPVPVPLPVLVNQPEEEQPNQNNIEEERETEEEDLMFLTEERFYSIPNVPNDPNDVETNNEEKENESSSCESKSDDSDEESSEEEIIASVDTRRKVKKCLENASCCGECQRLVEDESLYDDLGTPIQCDVCKEWYHPECLKEYLVDDYVDSLVEYEDQEFVCFECHQKTGKKRKRIWESEEVSKRMKTEE